MPPTICMNILKLNNVILSLLLLFALVTQCAITSAQEPIINVEHLVNAWDYLRSRGFKHPVEAAFYVNSYHRLQREVPNPQEIINYLDNKQQADGTYGRSIHYAPKLARVLYAYKVLGARPRTSLDPWFESINTWDKLVADIRRYELPGKYWGGLWGYVFTWIRYYGEAPPWINEVYNATENCPHSWLNDLHQRHHLYYMYFALQRPLILVDEVISLTLAEQGEDGRWINMEETAQTTHMLLALQMLGYDSGINESIARSIPFIESCYVSRMIGDTPVAYSEYYPGGPADLHSLGMGIGAAINVGLISGSTDPLWTEDYVQ